MSRISDTAKRAYRGALKGDDRIPLWHRFTAAYKLLAERRGTVPAMNKEAEVRWRMVKAYHDRLLAEHGAESKEWIAEAERRQEQELAQVAAACKSRNGNSAT